MGAFVFARARVRLSSVQKASRIAEIFELLDVSFERVKTRYRRSWRDSRLRFMVGCLFALDRENAGLHKALLLAKERGEDYSLRPK